MFKVLTYFIKNSFLDIVSTFISFIFPKKKKKKIDQIKNLIAKGFS